MDLTKKGLKLGDVVMDLWLVVGLTRDLRKKGLKRKNKIANMLDPHLPLLDGLNEERIETPGMSC